MFATSTTSRVRSPPRASLSRGLSALLAEGAGTRNGASTRAGTIRVAMGRRALAFEDKPNNSCEQVQ
jgi:hypothetical protein